MPPLPVVSGMEARRAFENDGWIFKRQKGSHMILTKQGMRVTLSIPNHKELDRGTLRSLISDIGLTVDEFMNLLG
ncbi:type II toxin-antitoxin system HicA family toxin [Ammoniphilus sp. CFH 90114]|uniref:type II toxin-antitoxin system HicA family toxin n=1 Tax=Ammoniphilus sp. CFH 90114 TaxID=2493665 RepID=UPI00100FFFDB|nr:type II toxin-antitoxin system HicA family toxin [Ammoniphilus sp. CFH 90114]RXT03661.1 type II toxin-antitoxin system HicA family toxin [Ammoniphilus sp. CFH 90114]